MINYIDEQVVAKACGAPVEQVREWVEENKITGRKRKDGTVEVAENEYVSIKQERERKVKYFDDLDEWLRD